MGRLEIPFNIETEKKNVTKMSLQKTEKIRDQMDKIKGKPRESRFQLDEEEEMYILTS